MNSPRSIPALLLFLVFGLLSFPGMVWAGTSPNALELSWYDNGMAMVLDKAIALTDYQFTKIKVTSPSQEVAPIELSSIGKALVLIEKMNRGLERNSFAAAIQADVSYLQEPLGTLVLRWHPSRDFLAFIVGFIFYRMDRAYIWPQFLLDQFPGWFPPEIRYEPFEMEWRQLHLLMASKTEKAELAFLKSVVSRMQLLNPEVDEYSGAGRVSYYGYQKTNKTIFIFDVSNTYPGSLRCTQRLQTDFNPFTNSLQFVRGHVGCDWP